MDILYWTTQTILALEPPNIEFLTAEFTQIPLPMTPPLPGHSQFTCNPPSTRPNNSTGFTAGASFNLGQGNFTPVYAQLVADGTEMIIVARKIPAVLLFNVSNGTTSSVPLGRRRIQHHRPARRLRLHRRQPGLRRRLRSVRPGR